MQEFPLPILQITVAEHSIYVSKSLKFLTSGNSCRPLSDKPCITTPVIGRKGYKCHRKIPDGCKLCDTGISCLPIKLGCRFRLQPLAGLKTESSFFFAHISHCAGSQKIDQNFSCPSKGNLNAYFSVNFTV